MKAILYADGASRRNPGPSGAGAILMTEDHHVLAEIVEYLGTATNNVAEYTALIRGLEEAKRRGVEEIEVRMDSLLVVEQVSGKWKVKHPNMKTLHPRAVELWRSFPKHSIIHIPRELNVLADALSNRAIDEAR